MILLQINFPFPVHMMGDTLTENARELAQSINKETGFISKVWIENTQTQESGGIYLFENRETAEQYVQMHTKRLEAMGVTEIECKYFHVNEPLSKINQSL